MAATKDVKPAVVTRLSVAGRAYIQQLADRDFAGNAGALSRDAMMQVYPGLKAYESSERMRWIPLPGLNCDTPEAMPCDVPLTDDEHATVSQADYPHIMQWKWHHANGRARRTISEGDRTGKLTLDRAIAEKLLPDMIIERILFIDGNRLNCQRANLQVMGKEGASNGPTTELQPAGHAE